MATGMGKSMSMRAGKQARRQALIYKFPVPYNHHTSPGDLAQQSTGEVLVAPGLVDHMFVLKRFLFNS